MPAGLGRPQRHVHDHVLLAADEPLAVDAYRAVLKRTRVMVLRARRSSGPRSTDSRTSAGAWAC
ncbi:hypothetical protein OG866_10875 [Streptomyces sp. NBC_00663]|uniref:hypothetical protein n=1 Tax=Streptomyces sp. NBC_00663 TaxID=2975801 RepID=UPI002E311A28|nr:hypothetical protein [Streptomyces sp. NBC_00663]